MKGFFLLRETGEIFTDANSLGFNVLDKALFRCA